MWKLRRRQHFAFDASQRADEVRLNVGSHRHEGARDGEPRIEMPAAAAAPPSTLRTARSRALDVLTISGSTICPSGRKTLNALPLASSTRRKEVTSRPSGPIANPGQGAILAALYPEPVDYLFFVAQGDGSHFFSKDYNAHVKAVDRYRKNKRNSKHVQAKEPPK